MSIIETELSAYSLIINCTVGLTGVDYHYKRSDIYHKIYYGKFIDDWVYRIHFIIYMGDGKFFEI